MCVTSGPAQMGDTQVFTFDPNHNNDHRAHHITAYLNTAINASGTPNCMLLHFPAQELPELVLDGLNAHTDVMRAVTHGLPRLSDGLPDDNGDWHLVSRGVETAVVQAYGDYHVVIANSASDIPQVLNKVPVDRRPPMTTDLENLIGWYDEHFFGYRFLLCCFNGHVRPSHPIVVSWIPDNDDVLFAPGLDGHTGELPRLGEPMPRNFRVAFGLDGVNLPKQVELHRPNPANHWWVPESVTGFFDDRVSGINSDYVVPRLTIAEGMSGRELLEDLVL